jgi:hypothetical protein
VTVSATPQAMPSPTRRRVHARSSRTVAHTSAALAASAKREANVRAFNDVFALSGWVAICFLTWLLLEVMLRNPRVKQVIRRQPAGAPNQRAET